MDISIFFPSLERAFSSSNLSKISRECFSSLSFSIRDYKLKTRVKAPSGLPKGQFLGKAI